MRRFLSFVRTGRAPGASIVLASLLLAAAAAEAQVALPPITSSDVEGRLWNDLNGNGWAEAHEPGLPGVTIYADENLNGRLDRDEPSVVSRRDDPRTRADEAGHYSLPLVPGEHLLRVVAPADAQTTHPSNGHLVSLGFGHLVSGIDFGLALSTIGLVHGVVWHDGNRDGVRDPDEPGIAGVTVYADLNRNCLFDEGDLVAESAEDDPGTAVDETGRYWLTDVPPGHIPLRIVQPFDAFPVSPNDGLHTVYVPIDEGVSDVDFGLAPNPAGYLPTSVDRLDVAPTLGLSVVETAHVSISPFCFTPHQLDAVPTDRWALFENLDGVQLNGCGGDTTTFSMEFRSTTVLQCYQLQIRDDNLDTLLTSIPIRVPEPATGLSLAVGALGLATASVRRRRGVGCNR